MRHTYIVTLELTFFIEDAVANKNAKGNKHLMLKMF